MLRIIREPVYYTTVANPDEIAQVLRRARPGRFIVEDVAPAGQLLASGHSCRRWGMAIRDADGKVMLDPDPWPV
jgi:hypothetical protein